MKALVLVTLVLLLLMTPPNSAYSQDQCDDANPCTAPFKCLDPYRTGTNACWQVCRPEVPSVCNGYCCKTFTSPVKVSVCVDDASCNTDTSDGDSVESDAESTEGFISCTDDSDVCSSLQSCIKLDDGRKLCAPLCKSNGDCASNCCADISTGQQACMPGDIPCPQNDDDGSSKGGCDANPLCDSGSLNGSSGGLLLLCARGLHLFRRRLHKV